MKTHRKGLELIFHLIWQQTRKETKLGDCNQRACTIINSHCNSLTFKCDCNEGYIKTDDLMRCIKSSVALGQPCEREEQCFKSDSISTCKNGKCECLENAGKFENRCHSLVEIGQHCIRDKECQKFTVNSKCILNQCACDRGFVVFDEDNVSWNGVSRLFWTN